MVFDSKAYVQTKKLAKEKFVQAFLIVQSNSSERFRFLVSPVESTEVWTNLYSDVTPYKKRTELDFGGQLRDTMTVKARMFTSTKTRDLNPLFVRLKSCMQPLTNPSGTDSLNPPLLSLVIGDQVYKNLYLQSVSIQVTERFNGFPIAADLSLSFVSTQISYS